MSELAKKLANVPPPSRHTKRGPDNLCHPLYGDGDMAAFEAIEQLRGHGMTWKDVQVHVDKIMKVTDDRRLDSARFRRHWRRQCYCWADRERA